MNEQNLISIIIPVYKVEEYLDSCVESIVKQTYKNIEIILVDDGSPDKCPQMCDKWALKDSRIKVLHKKNEGLGKARNSGLVIAKGEYIGFVDSDDWCESNMFELMLEACIRFNTKISICDVAEEYECGWPTEYTSYSKNCECFEQKKVLQKFFSGELAAWACNKLYKRDLINLLHYSSQNFEDIPVTRAILLYVNNVAFTGKVGYHYRKRQNSIVTSKINKSQLMLIYELQKNADYAKKYNLGDIASAQLVLMCFKFLTKMISAKNKDFEKNIIELLDIIKANKRSCKYKNARKIDCIFIHMIAYGIPYKIVFGIWRFLLWFYWTFNLKSKK